MKNIIVLDSDAKQGHELCEVMTEQGYPCLAVTSIHELDDRLPHGDCLGLFIDIDTISITNNEIEQMSLKYPGTYFFCLTKHRFHPELKDAICYHVYACLNRPIDPDELTFWIRSIHQDDRMDVNSRS